MQNPVATTSVRPILLLASAVLLSLGGSALRHRAAPSAGAVAPTQVLVRSPRPCVAVIAIGRSLP